MPITNPTDVWSKKLRNHFKDKPKLQVEKFLNIVEILMFSKDNFEDISTLYSEFELEDFAKLISIFNGRTVKFPTIDEFRANIELALVFYYREFHNVKDYDELKKLIPFEINSISVGNRMAKLTKDIHAMVMKEYNEGFFKENKIE